MAVKFRYIDRVVLPRRSSGVDWSGERIVLARYGNKELWWRKSGSTWQAVGLYGHEPAALMLVKWEDKRQRGVPAIRRPHEGGRLSQKVLQEHAEAIDEWFGMKVAYQLGPVTQRPPKTLEVSR